MPILEIKDITKTYESGTKKLTVLNSISFSIEKGITCAIVGPSGSGKTTLLGLCAGLDAPTAGSVILHGHHLENLTEDRLAEIRNRHIGFVFQSFQLIPTLTAVENVMVPVELRGGSYSQVFDKAKALLKEVGLADRMDHYPTQLSGGVGIARAFINEPQILFADEPTGNLDTETGAQIEDILFDINKKQKTTLVIVTHDLELAAKCDRTIRLKGGQIIDDSSNPKSDKTEKMAAEAHV